MSMQIIFSPGKCITHPASGTIEDVLRELEINPVDVLISCNGIIIPEDTPALDDMTIRIIKISHGG